MADQGGLDQQGIQELVARGYIEEASESAVDLGGSVVDDAVEHRIFASVAEQAERNPGYFVPVVSTRFQRHSQSHSQRHLYE